MIWLVLGLLMFLGVHSTRMLAPHWRDARIAAIGERKWKGIYSLVSIVGFVLLIWGYGQAKAGAPIVLWMPPTGLRHAAALLTLPAFVLVVAAYVPRNHFKAWLGHPMVLGVALWAAAHLLVNGWLHGVILFGSFLLWAVLDYLAARRREPAGHRGGTLAGTALSLLIGFAAWAGFAFYLHMRWIGVAPFG